MIVRPRGDGLLLHRQVDHAWHCALLAARLRDAPEPRARFIRAVAMHDNGWVEQDAAPLVDDEGRARPYSDMPRAPYREVWRRGVARAVAADPYAGLLVSLHGSRFLGKGEEGRELLAEERARQDALLTGLGLRGGWDALPSPVAEHHAWLGFLDAVSLFVLDEWASPATFATPGGEVAVARDGDDVRVEPSPFTARVEARVPGVMLPASRYGTDALRAAFGSGERVARRVVVE